MSTSVQQKSQGIAWLIQHSILAASIPAPLNMHTNNVFHGFAPHKGKIDYTFCR